MTPEQEKIEELQKANEQLDFKLQREQRARSNANAALLMAQELLAKRFDIPNEGKSFMNVLEAVTDKFHELQSQIILHRRNT